jgi:organic radical activating enzyme
LDRLLRGLAGLEGSWEVKVTGGEPFVFPGFLDRVVPGLVARGHRVSVLTNLSAPVEELERFAHLAGERLAVVSASLHLDSTTPVAFLGRLEALRAAAHPGTRVVVNSVLVPDRLAQVRAARQVVEERGFRFFPQVMKVKHGIHPYSPDQVKEVAMIVGGLERAEASREANLAPSYSGRRCLAGWRYFVLMQDGAAWACRSGRRHGQGWLGNVASGTWALRPEAKTCPYPMCPCAVPANRGMVEGVPARAGGPGDG